MSGKPGYIEKIEGLEKDVPALDTSLRALIWEKVQTLNTEIAGKAPTHHASAGTTYGVGTGGMYGHVKLSDYADLNNGVAQGVAVTPRALRTTVPAGTVVAFAGNPSSSPLGYLLCAGAAVSRTTYPDLFSAIGTTYGEGNGSTTFNLPNLSDARYIQGSSTAGKKLDPGIPNITGAFSLDINAGEFYTHPATGAFSYESAGDEGAQGDGAPSSRISFDAAKSSPNAGNVYGKHSTIRPLSLTMRYYIKY
jgi:microcystin-dependent protein